MPGFHNNLMNKLHALVLGATGATGQEIVNCLLMDPSIEKVSIFVRRKPSFQNKKLAVHIIDFSKLNFYKSFISGDILFSSLGTTLKDAGSKSNQFTVDYTYQLEFAKIALENGVDHYSLVSSYGANKNSIFFYLKTKGALEEEIKKLPFRTIQIFQPPTLIRQSEIMRPSEKMGIKLLNFFNKLGILKSQKPLPVTVLAKKMTNEIQNNSGVIKTYAPREII